MVGSGQSELIGQERHPWSMVRKMF